MGGAEKTQLVLQYISLHKLNYLHIFWIDAIDNDSLKQTFEKIAVEVNLTKELGLKGPKDPEYHNKITGAVKSWFEQPGGGRWLLVFDNADNKETLLNIQQLVPQSGRGDVILISCLQDSCNLWLRSSIEVKDMKGTEALDLSLRRASYGQ